MVILCLAWLILPLIAWISLQHFHLIHFTVR